jgi:uncharacterized membrane protein
MSRKTAARWLIAGGMGATLALCGLTLASWQYWVVLCLWIADGINEGINEGNK